MVTLIEHRSSFAAGSILTVHLILLMSMGRMFAVLPIKAIKKQNSSGLPGKSVVFSNKNFKALDLNSLFGYFLKVLYLGFV